MVVSAASSLLGFAFDGRQRRFLEPLVSSKLRSHARQIEPLLADLDDLIRPPAEPESTVGVELDAIAGGEFLSTLCDAHERRADAQNPAARIACHARAGEGRPQCFAGHGLLGAPGDAACLRRAQHLDWRMA